MSLSGPAIAWAWTQSNVSGETWKRASAPIQPDRAWEVRRRIADNCQMLMSKACRIKQKRLEAVKVLQLNIKGTNTYAMYLFQLFIFL